MDIIFDRPKVKKDYACVDMHVHSNYSDGAATPSDILEKCRSLGIGVAICDHNTILGNLEYHKIKGKEDFIIPGIEVKSSEAIDILFYFYTIEEMKKFYNIEIKNKLCSHMCISSKTTIPLKKIIQISKNYKCIISVAHPYGYTMRGGKSDSFNNHFDVLKDVDIVEAINGGTKRNYNQMAIDYITKNKKKITGGSDAHSKYPIGNVLTCSKAKNVKEFLDNIKSGDNFVVGQEIKNGKWGEYFYYAKNKLSSLFKRT